ncbi:putative clathrin assembly protein [Camellia lanceoleosa]|uniref:Clathrin assembly protein n=1 Tax=Camellia lanceoleosa TaxID=1840588 RepID=A0ACC0ILE3_9ERIC|nr:putative clathrin assembly protein [Camellia lanceoleosa]
MSALPAPPAADGSVAATTGADPFAASLPVPPPAFVQMSEMEKKQRMLVEEQLMWQQYARDGMHGQVGLTNMQPNTYPYNMEVTHILTEALLSSAVFFKVATVNMYR